MSARAEALSYSTNTETNRDDRGDLIICPMLCYSNGTDKKNLKKNYHSLRTVVPGTSLLFCNADVMKLSL